MDDTYPPIVIEQTLEASPQEVWKALTDVQEMKKWYFDNIPAFEAQVGFETGFTVQVEDRVFPHLWKVTKVIPEKKIAYDWRFEGYPGASNVSFELFGRPEGTLLRLTAVVLKPFPDDIPEFKRESGVAGWNYFIKERLTSYFTSK